MNYNAENDRIKAVNELPVCYQSLYRESFSFFNPLQSEIFHLTFNHQVNMVVCAPTGSGKTVVMELAILNLMKQYINGDGRFQVEQVDKMKAMYVAPIRALVSEKAKEWKEKFECKLGLKVQEFTGDDISQDVDLTKADIICTTPEKFDAITRQHHRQNGPGFVGSIALVLIDEVHQLHSENRGSSLEAGVVGRLKMLAAMPSMQQEAISRLRFVAVSATIPNARDIAEWLNVPAEGLKVYGEEMRPVKLRTKVLAYNPMKTDFFFEKRLTNYVLGIIREYSKGKPTLVFCSSRKGALETAQQLTEELRNLPFNSRIVKDNGHGNRLIHASQLTSSKPLQTCLPQGVAFHHAAVEQNDRELVQRLFMQHEIMVLCTTSTLAMGVNLPAHLVIIKGTRRYCGPEDVPCGGLPGYKEYERSECLQMIGRAGRPQFDTEGVAIIMTQKQMAYRYENLTSGIENVESRLLDNFPEHLNAEIVLRTITTVEAANYWINNTFLKIRVQSNPGQYKLSCQNIGDLNQIMKEKIVDSNIQKLVRHNMVQLVGDELVATEVGRLMAMHYIEFPTMVKICQSQKHLSMPKLLHILSSAHELRHIRIRRGEKGILNKINTAKPPHTPRFVIPSEKKIAKPKDKIQNTEEKIFIMVNEGLNDNPSDLLDYSMKLEMDQILRVGRRITACMVRYFSDKKEFAGTANSVLLHKSLKQKMWDTSKNQCRQLPNIGKLMGDRLVQAGIGSLQDLANADPRKIETVTQRNYPFGSKVKEDLKRVFPPSLELIVVYKSWSTDGCLKVDVTLSRIKEVDQLLQKCPAVLLIGCTHNDHLMMFEHVALDSFQSPYMTSCETVVKQLDKTVTIVGAVLHENLIGADTTTVLTANFPTNQNHREFTTTQQQLLDTQQEDGQVKNTSLLLQQNNSHYSASMTTRQQPQAQKQTQNIQKPKLQFINLSPHQQQNANVNFQLDENKENCPIQQQQNNQYQYMQNQQQEKFDNYQLGNATVKSDKVQQGVQHCQQQQFLYNQPGKNLQYQKTQQIQQNQNLILCDSIKINQLSTGIEQKQNTLNIQNPMQDCEEVLDKNINYFPWASQDLKIKQNETQLVKVEQTQNQKLFTQGIKNNNQFKVPKNFTGNKTLRKIMTPFIQSSFSPQNNKYELQDQDILEANEQKQFPNVNQELEIRSKFQHENNKSLRNLDSESQQKQFKKQHEQNFLQTGSVKENEESNKFINNQIQQDVGCVKIKQEIIEKPDEKLIQDEIHQNKIFQDTQNTKILIQNQNFLNQIIKEEIVEQNQYKIAISDYNQTFIEENKTEINNSDHNHIQIKENKTEKTNASSCGKQPNNHDVKNSNLNKNVDVINQDQFENICKIQQNQNFEKDFQTAKTKQIEQQKQISAKQSEDIQKNLINEKINKNFGVQNQKKIFKDIDENNSGNKVMRNKIFNLQNQDINRIQGTRNEETYSRQNKNIENKNQQNQLTNKTFTKPENLITNQQNGNTALQKNQQGISEIRSKRRFDCKINNTPNSKIIQYCNRDKKLIQQQSQFCVNQNDTNNTNTNTIDKAVTKSNFENINKQKFQQEKQGLFGSNTKATSTLAKLMKQGANLFVSKPITPKNSSNQNTNFDSNKKNNEHQISPNLEQSQTHQQKDQRQFDQSKNNFVKQEDVENSELKVEYDVLLNNCKEFLNKNLKSCLTEQNQDQNEIEKIAQKDLLNTCPNEKIQDNNSINTLQNQTTQNNQQKSTPNNQLLLCYTPLKKQQTPPNFQQINQYLQDRNNQQQTKLTSESNCNFKQNFETKNLNNYTMEQNDRKFNMVQNIESRLNMQNTFQLNRQNQSFQYQTQSDGSEQRLQRGNGKSKGVDFRTTAKTPDSTQTKLHQFQCRSDTSPQNYASVMAQNDKFVTPKRKDYPGCSISKNVNGGSYRSDQPTTINLQDDMYGSRKLLFPSPQGVCWKDNQLKQISENHFADENILNCGSHLESGKLPFYQTQLIQNDNNNKQLELDCSFPDDAIFDANFQIDLEDEFEIQHNLQTKFISSKISSEVNTKQSEQKNHGGSEDGLICSPQLRKKLNFDENKENQGYFQDGLISSPVLKTNLNLLGEDIQIYSQFQQTNSQKQQIRKPLERLKSSSNIISSRPCLNGLDTNSNVQSKWSSRIFQSSGEKCKRISGLKKFRFKSENKNDDCVSTTSFSLKDMNSKQFKRKIYSTDLKFPVVNKKRKMYHKN